MNTVAKIAALTCGGVALLMSGFAIGRFTAPSAPIPDGYVDLSGISPEARDMIGNAGFFDMLSAIVHVENGQLTLTGMAEPARASLTMPEGFPAWPSSLSLSAPVNGMHWIDATFPGSEMLAGARGKWTVVNLWASWCAPCVAELPDFNKLAAAVSDDVSVFTLNADLNGKDTPEAVAKLFSANGYTALAPIVVQGDAFDDVIASAGMTRTNLSYPMTVIFAPDGKPFAYVQDSADGWEKGALSGWAEPAMIAFFKKLATMPAPPN